MCLSLLTLLYFFYPPLHIFCVRVNTRRADSEAPFRARLHCSSLWGCAAVQHDWRETHKRLCRVVHTAPTANCCMLSRLCAAGGEEGVERRGRGWGNEWVEGAGGGGEEEEEGRRRGWRVTEQTPLPIWQYQESGGRRREWESMTEQNVPVVRMTASCQEKAGVLNACNVLFFVFFWRMVRAPSKPPQGSEGIMHHGNSLCCFSAWSSGSRRLPLPSPCFSKKCDTLQKVNNRRVNIRKSETERCLGRPRGCSGTRLWFFKVWLKSARG